MGLSNAITKTLTAHPTLARGEADADVAIVRRVQNGDVTAFDQLVLKYRERLFGIIYNLTSNREDASDLAQEAFIKAFTSIKHFQEKSSFFTWLYRIAINTALSHIKRNRMRQFFSFETLTEEVKSSEIIEALAVKTNSDKATMANELQEKLNEALQKLSPNHRSVVVLFEIEGLSHQEISEIMNCSVGTVRSRLHYAKRELQAHLQQYLK